MRFLSRDDLLQLSPDELMATAECHGLDVEGRQAADVLDELADWIEDFRTLAVAEEEEE